MDNPSLGIKNKITIEEALEKIGYGKYTIFLTLSCGLGLFAVNAEIYSMSFILPAAECEFNLDTGSKSALTAACLLGMIISSQIWGFIADTRGRKSVIIVCLMIAFCCVIGASLATQFWAYLLFKFLCGLFMSGSSAAIFAYMGEFVCRKYRSRSIVACSLIAGCNLIFTSLLAWGILPLKGSVELLGHEYKAWRLFDFLIGIPLLLSAIILCCFPESPKFVLHQGKQEKLLQLLRIISQRNTSGPLESFDNFNVIEEKNNLTKDETCFMVLKSQTLPLFNKEHVINTITTCSLQFGIATISSGFFLWYSDILNQMSGQSGSENLTVCKAIIASQTQDVENAVCTEHMDVSIFRQNLIMGATYAVSYICIIFVMQKVLKKIILVVIYITGCVAIIVICYITNSIAIDAIFVIILVIPGTTGTVISAIVVELFPTNLRTTAVSISFVFHRIGSVIASSIIGYLLELNCLVTFYLYAAILISCACIAAVIPKKAKY